MTPKADHIKISYPEILSFSQYSLIHLQKYFKALISTVKYFKQYKYHNYIA